MEGAEKPITLFRSSRRENFYMRVLIKQWKKEQASHCCTADVCLCQSVNQLYNEQEMAKLVLLSTACMVLNCLYPALGLFIP